MTIRHFFIFLHLLLLCATSVSALDVPPLRGRINDQVGLIKEDFRDRLESSLGQLEQETGTQVGVLIIPELEGDSLEEFSIKVVETWQLGRTDIDDGLLLLIVHKDRKIRIEVGYGLEHQLTDLYCGRVISQLLVPAFKKGLYQEGIEAAITSIAEKIKNDIELMPDIKRNGPPKGSMIVILFFSVLMVPFGYLSIAIKGNRGWTIYLFLAPFFYILASMYSQSTALISLGSWLIILPFLRTIWPEKWKVESDKRSASSSSSRRRGSGYSGRGGFSGGGGSFGGGGSSGSW